MKLKNNESGFILVQVLVGIIVTGIVAAAFMSMSNYSLQSTRSWKNSDRAYLIAKSALEKTKYDIYETFLAHYHASPRAKTLGKVKWYDNIGQGSIGVDDAIYEFPVNAKLTNEDGVTPDWAENGTYTVDISTQDKSYMDRYVRISVTATIDGQSRTVEEFLTYGLNTNVFMYAYFVNNFGWLHGASINMYGDVRSNGNMSLKSNPYVNGDVYASKNPALGTLGVVDGAWKYYNTSMYPKKATDSARPMDTTEQPFSFGYTGDVAELEGERPLEMPFLGELDDYKDLANSQNGTVKALDHNDQPVLVNGVYSGFGPDGIEGTPDDGCLVLDGRTTPIVIDGPIVVEKDLIILGNVSGKGTIFAGRNIHVVGNVTATNPLNIDKDAKMTEAEHLEAMKNADMLGLAAKGNIILGNYTSSYWQKKVMPYISDRFVNDYETDPSDADIGYDSDNIASNGYHFDGDYTDFDGGDKVSDVPVPVELNGQVSGSRRTYVFNGDGTTFTQNIKAGDTVLVNGVNYTVASVNSDTQITVNERISRNVNNASVSAMLPGGATPRKYYESSLSDALFNQLSLDKQTGNGNEIDRLDAVFYTNHLLGGDVGQLDLTGSLVARDEAVIFTGQLTMTWDCRLAYDMGDIMGEDGDSFLPPSPAPPKSILMVER